MKRVMIFLQRILCLFGKHKYEVTQEFSYSRRIACRYCGGVWGMNDDVRVVVPWGPCFHRMYENHGHAIVYKSWEFKRQKSGEIAEGKK